METTFNVQGMTCEHCKMSVEDSLNTLDGVAKAEVHLASSEVNVTFDTSKVTMKTLQEAIEDQGYDVEA